MNQEIHVLSNKICECFKSIICIYSEVEKFQKILSLNYLFRNLAKRYPFGLVISILKTIKIHNFLIKKFLFLNSKNFFFLITYAVVIGYNNIIEINFDIIFFVKNF